MASFNPIAAAEILVTDEIIKESNIEEKYIIIPMILFYIIDIAVIHDNNLNIFKVNIPILKEIFEFVYNITSKIIFDKYHSQPLAHTIIFGVGLILFYKLYEQYNLNKSQKIMLNN